MANLEELLAEQRTRLLRSERSAAAELARSYRSTLRRFNEDLAALSEQISEARAAGEDLRGSWLYRQRRYENLIADLEVDVLRFLGSSSRQIERQKEGAIAAAHDEVPATASAAAGAAPRLARAMIEGSFDRLPSAAFRQLVANAGDGRPLGMLLAEISPQTIDKVRDALSSGLASGRPVREIARDVRKAAYLPLDRALTISRTETMRAYRETTLQMHRESSAIEAWTWYATADGRTCPACWAKHGTEHTLDESLDSHPNCRCTQVPVVASWRDLGFDIPDNRPEIPSGDSLFETLADQEQHAVLGAAKFDAYAAGEIRVADLARDTYSARWGGGIRSATLAELGIA